jgi:hypothetical protein
VPGIVGASRCEESLSASVEQGWPGQAKAREALASNGGGNTSAVEG